MKAKRQSAKRLVYEGPLRKSCIRVAALLLLILVAGLATLAKNVQYLPKSNSAHYINCATKMKVSQAAPEADRKPLHPIAKVVPARPIYRPSRQDEPETPPIRLIGLTVSLQHRSPPPSLS
jgi:hypothetical protein